MCIILINDLEICCGSDANINIYNMDSGKIVKNFVGH